MESPLLNYQCDKGIALITINRPEKLNAFTPAMAEQFIALLDRTDADDDVKAVIVTGAGRAFCAGADLSGGKETFGDISGKSDVVNADGSINYSAEAIRDIGGLVSLRIYRSLKPIIAAINGAAVGVGITMTLPMDIRIASTEAKAGFVFTRRAIVPEATSSFFLPRIVGISKALEWSFSGRIISVQEMLNGALISEVLAPELLLDRAYEIAREIADNTAPVSVALTRQMLWRGLDMQHPMEAHQIDSRAVAHRGRSKDATEGIESFLEKRQPDFKNKVSTDMPDFYPWWDEPKYE
ncbi:crotonase/enoyl-CoA hydratase family protein [Zhongshania sp. BJYM1]|uniref:crotonase/enoyl-CoA hydratase family protein n=1 Tax=Zhongshania aquatica TaxID=2965069 RepID=UPI0022B3D2DB|nr:crotonase/enoyl-CoA hydratase family protein [Marortus sp. BJYM1]